MGFDVINNGNAELDDTKRDKKYGKFVYPDSFIKLILYTRLYFYFVLKLSYYVTESCYNENSKSQLEQLRITLLMSNVLYLIMKNLIYIINLKLNIIIDQVLYQ